MRPIRVYQCKGDCCVVRVPSRRFWIVQTPGTWGTFTSFHDAVWDASGQAQGLPGEPS